MTNEKKYQYLSLALGVLALIFAVLYFTKDSTMSVSEIVASFGTDLESCKQQIEQWQQENITAETQEVSEEAREELNALLEECTDTIEQNQNRL